MDFLPDTVGAFEMGSLFMTSSVFGATCEHAPFGDYIRACILRHQSCDWGDEQVLCKSNEAIQNGFICEELQPTGLQRLQHDFYNNDAALLNGSRIFSSYMIPDSLYTLESKIWIITESSREHTTVLFPSEY